MTDRPFTAEEIAELDAAKYKLEAQLPEIQRQLKGLEDAKKVTRETLNMEFLI